MSAAILDHFRRPEIKQNSVTLPLIPSVYLLQTNRVRDIKFKLLIGVRLWTYSQGNYAFSFNVQFSLS